MKNKKFNIWRNISIAACTLFVTTGVVFAGNIVVEKVFKEPKKYESYNEVIADIQADYQTTEITEEDKKSLINEEQAKNSANELLNKFGYENQNFEKVELKEPGVYGKDTVYVLDTNKNADRGIVILVDAKTGKWIGFTDFDLSYNNIISDPISKEEAIKYSNEMYKLFGLEEEEYKLKLVEGGPSEHSESNDNMYLITYCKTYDGAFNQFESFNMQLGYKNGKPFVYGIGISNEDIEFKNNPIQKSKEEAKKIALEEDKKITNNEVDFIVTNLGIRQMNSYIYLLAQNGGQYPGFVEEELEDGTIQRYPKYKTVEKIARKVWVVNIHYKENDPSTNFNAKSIFVDVTTGEIIGGSVEAVWEEK